MSSPIWTTSSTGLALTRQHPDQRGGQDQQPEQQRLRGHDHHGRRAQDRVGGASAAGRSDGPAAATSSSPIPASTAVAGSACAGSTGVR